MKDKAHSDDIDANSDAKKVNQRNTHNKEHISLGTVI